LIESVIKLKGFKVCNDSSCVKKMTVAVTEDTSKLWKLC